MKLLSRVEIDSEKWDACITSSINAKPYGLSYWLDCVSPGWQGIVMGDYRSVMPVHTRSLLWIRKVAQPPFTQQLGLFMTDPVDLEGMADIFQLLKKKYRRGYIQLNEANFSEVVKDDLNSRKNYKIRYDHLDPSNYSSSHKRNLNKARKSGLQLISLDTPSFISGYQRHNPVYLTHIRRHRKTFAGLIKVTDQRGMGKAVGISDGKDVLAAVWFITFQDTAYYLLPFTTKKGRAAGAMHLLITDLPLILPDTKYMDFEGSELPGVEKFILGFDAQLYPYPTVSW